MSRTVRIKSETGIYHVMLRGINKQQIFNEPEDYFKFLSILGICKDLSGFKLHAYCLMNNHVHFLIEEGNEPTEKIFKRIGVRYVYWFNTKYDRIGGLFQDRYKSIPVNDDQYYISVLRYIHQNPVKAGLVKNCGDYDFSSYNAYFNYAPLVDTDFTMGLMSIDEFERIHSEPCKETHMEISEENIVHITMEDAQKLFEVYTHCKTSEEFQKLPRDMQSAYVNLMKKQHFTYRQISSLTGLSLRFVSSN